MVFPDNFEYPGRPTHAFDEKPVVEELEKLLEQGVGNRSFEVVCDEARSQKCDDLVRLLIEKAITPKIEQQQRNRVFLGAVILGDSQIVAGLLHSGAEVNTKCGDSGNALQVAIHREHYHLVPILLNYDINVNASGGPYDTALGAACYKGKEELVRRLLSHGAEIEPTCEGAGSTSALQHACRKGKESVVKLLVERGAKVNYVSKKYGTALQAASISGIAEITKLLLESGAGINTHDQTHPSALQRAC
jgi:ankyrin repeat protein